MIKIVRLIIKVMYYIKVDRTFGLVVITSTILKNIISMKMHLKY